MNNWNKYEQSYENTCPKCDYDSLKLGFQIRKDKDKKLDWHQSKDYYNPIVYIECENRNCDFERVKGVKFKEDIVDFPEEDKIDVDFRGPPGLFIGI